MQVGGELLAAARAVGARSLFVIGTGKNVGKTVTLRAVYEAAYAQGVVVGLASVGRDGEAFDIGDAKPKPRLWLRPGTVLATATSVVPRSPASAVLEVSSRATAVGGVVYLRVVVPGYFELVGPPTARGVRDIAQRLLAYGDFAVVDGALDRLAAVAGGDDAIVVACGASGRATMDEEVAAVGALVARLRLPAYEPSADCVEIEGALTPSLAAALIAAGERRQIVVADPTKIALAGRSAAGALAHLDLRCRRTLKPIAVTTASIGRMRSFEPRAFIDAVARVSGLPVYDIYAGMRAA